MTKMTSKVTWVSGLRFIGGSGSGHGAIMDGSQTSSSKEVLGPSPMEMVLMGLGGCSGIDVMHILERMRQTVTGCKVELEGERAEESPRVYKKIHLITQYLAITCRNRALKRRFVYPTRNTVRSLLC